MSRYAEYFDIDWTPYFRDRQAGAPFDGLVISAGIPETDEAVAIIEDLQASGIQHVVFKPGTVKQIRQVLAIAKEVDTTVVAHVEGGVAGGHHSWEDLDELLLATYADLRSVPNLVVLRGGMNAGERRAADAAMQANDGARLVLATGRYLGEGFDDPRLDTLFLTLPISWEGTLAQYVGRLHREHQGKSEVVVHDYIDAAVPVLTRMAAKRQAGYRSLGYVIEALGRDHPTMASALAA